MLKLCPWCKRLSVEYDVYHHLDKCLNKECGWVGRGKDSSGELTEFTPPSSNLSRILEERNRDRVRERTEV